MHLAINCNIHLFYIKFCVYSIFRYDELNRNISDTAAVTTILIGTKRKSRTREVTLDQCENYAEHLGLPFFEVDIDDESQILYIFQIIANSTVQKYKCRMSMSTSTTSSFSTSKGESTVLKVVEKAKQKCTSCSC